jgi:hypothetical protein
MSTPGDIATRVGEQVLFSLISIYEDDNKLCHETISEAEIACKTRVKTLKRKHLRGTRDTKARFARLEHHHKMKIERNTKILNKLIAGNEETVMRVWDEMELDIRDARGHFDAQKKEEVN